MLDHSHSQLAHPVVGPLLAAGGLASMAWEMIQHGLSLPAFGAVVGGVAMLINAVANASREYRAWKRPNEPKGKE